MNLALELNKCLSQNFVSALTIISDCAEDFCTKVFIVGGVVRDLLLKKDIYDIDIVVEGNAIEFCKYMQSRGMCTVTRISDEFGTAKVQFKQISDLSLDFASTRIESYPRAGHLPIVNKIGCLLEEDIIRRDFTVNALALSVNKLNFGELIDFTGGVEDIQKKELKILHDKSFIDDPTRIIRGLRFAHKLGFKLETQTKSFQQEYLSNFINNDICYERIKQVVKLAFTLNSAELYNEFISANVYKLLCNTPIHKDGYSVRNAIEKNIKYIDKENIWLVYLACCVSLQDCLKLNLTSKEMAIVSHLEQLLNNKIPDESNYSVYKFFKNISKEAIVAYLAITKNYLAQKYLDELMNIKIFVNGGDLIQLGYLKGRAIGEALEKILEEKINGKIKTKEDELKLAKKIMFEF